MSEQTLIGVQFRPVGKSYHFYLPADIEVEAGEYVIVNTARGKQIGKVTRKDMPESEAGEDILAVERKANSRDLLLKDMIQQKEAEAVEKTREFLSGNSNYEGVKVLDAEYSFDSSRLTLFLSYDNVPDFNMRNFIRETAPMFKDTRLGIRQVGPRDVAKEISGLGACGIEKRCCSRFLTDFSSISIRMAKSQNVSLTPTEITGICGRLRCCLAYEHDMYEEARKLLPKRKKLIQTPLGEGKVMQVLPLSDSVIVDLPELGPREITRTELETGKMEEKKPDKPLYESTIEEQEGDVEVIRLDTDKKTKPQRSSQKTKSRSSQRSDRSKGSTRQDRRPQTPKDETQRREKQDNTAKSKGQGKPKGNRRDRRYQKPDQQQNKDGN